MYNCRGDIVARSEAEDLIAKELGQHCCCFVLEYPNSGFHLIHDFMRKTSGEWREVSASFTSINNYCNIMRIHRSGISAKVILYAPWPEDTSVECHVSYSDDNDLRKVICLITGVFDTILAEKQCFIKCVCERQECIVLKRHLSNPDPDDPTYFVCEATQERYYCTSISHQLLATSTTLMHKCKDICTCNSKNCKIIMFIMLCSYNYV